MAEDAVVDVLRRARALVAQPRGWTQRSYARDAAGEQVAPYSPEAVSFCMDGALRRVTENDNGWTLFYFEEAWNALSRAVGTPPGWLRYPWNDAEGRTQEDVVSAYDRAIELRLAELGR